MIEFYKISKEKYNQIQDNNGLKENIYIIEDTGDMYVGCKIISKNLLKATDLYSYLNNIIDIQYSEVEEDNRKCIRFIDTVNVKYDKIAFKENTQYSISMDCKTVNRTDSNTTGSVLFVFFYTDGTESRAISLNSNTGWTHKTAKSAQNKTISAIGLVSCNHSNWCYIDIDTFQLQEGNPTKYEPYHEPYIKGIRMSSNHKIVDKLPNFNDAESGIIYISSDNRTVIKTDDSNNWIDILLDVDDLPSKNSANLLSSGGSFNKLMSKIDKDEVYKIQSSTGMPAKIINQIPGEKLKKCIVHGSDLVKWLINEETDRTQTLNGLTLNYKAPHEVIINGTSTRGGTYFKIYYDLSDLSINLRKRPKYIYIAVITENDNGKLKEISTSLNGNYTNIDFSFMTGIYFKKLIFWQSIGNGSTFEQESCHPLIHGTVGNLDYRIMNPSVLRNVQVLSGDLNIQYSIGNSYDIIIKAQEITEDTVIRLLDMEEGDFIKGVKVAATFNYPSSISSIASMKLRLYDKYGNELRTTPGFSNGIASVSFTSNMSTKIVVEAVIKAGTLTSDLQAMVRLVSGGKIDYCTIDIVHKNLINGFEQEFSTVDNVQWYGNTKKNLINCLGRPTKNTNFTIKSASNFTLPRGKYYLSGSPANRNESIYLYADVYNGSNLVQAHRLNGDDAESIIDLTEIEYTGIEVGINILENTITHHAFKPQIRVYERSRATFESSNLDPNGYADLLEGKIHNPGFGNVEASEYDINVVGDLNMLSGDDIEVICSSHSASPQIDVEYYAKNTEVENFKDKIQWKTL